MPKNTDKVFSKFKKIIVCELNTGQLAFVLKGKYTQFEFDQYNKVLGLPFSVTNMVAKFKDILKED
jgi:2-oxoglutarate ferredoxin oxidoreductase subunit alpha